MQRDGALLNMVLRNFLRAIAQTLQTHSPGAANVDKATLQIGVVALIHRFDPSLNEHVYLHFHGCVVNGVFEELAGGAIFHPVTSIDESAVAHVQLILHRRILRAFVGRGLLQSFDAKYMQGYQHSGFSVDAGVCVQVHDRSALEELRCYCARPPFALERLRKEGCDLVHSCAKQHSRPRSDKRVAKADEIRPKPLELIARIAALVLTPRPHLHHYFGVL